jgi:hypothetical protein
MKTLNEILGTLYRPKAGDEKGFVNQHTVKVSKNSKPTENDAQFTSGKVKPAPKPGPSYKPGEDEKAYDNGRAVGIHDQKKVTAIAPYTIKATEEVEPIEELSPKTLKSYVKKATTSQARSDRKGDSEEDKAMSTDGNKNPWKQRRHERAASAHFAKSWKRGDGLKTANMKLAIKKVDRGNS